MEEKRRCRSVSARKAKGRRAAMEAKEAILKAFPHLLDDDVLVTSSGVTGEDLILSPLARKSLPFTFELKNQESLNIWACLKQAETHPGKRDLTPLLVFRRNHSKLYLAMDFEAFLKLYETKLSEPNRSLS